MSKTPFFLRFVEATPSVESELKAGADKGKYVTLKYPSDNDEHYTMKYPSDDDESYSK